MSHWYYVDAQQQRQGPLEAAQLATAFQQKLLTPDTLVWREGLPQWVALHSMSAEPALQAIFSQAPAPAGLPPMPLSAHAHDEPASPYAPPVSLSSSSQAVMAWGSDIVLAGFWKRVAAMVIDSLILTAALFLVVIIGLLLIGGANAFSPEAFASDLAKGTLGLGFILLVYILPIFMQAAYFSWMHAVGPQATLGKMAVGIKVTRGDGQALTLGRSFGRWAAYFFLNLFSCGVTSLVSAFTAGLSARKQAVHDMVADTLVVDRWAFTAHPERQRRELGAVTISVIALGVLLCIAYVVLLVFVATLAPQH